VCRAPRRAQRCTHLTKHLRDEARLTLGRDGLLQQRHAREHLVLLVWEVVGGIDQRHQVRRGEKARGACVVLGKRSPPFSPLENFKNMKPKSVWRFRDDACDDACQRRGRGRGCTSEGRVRWRPGASGSYGPQRISPSLLFSHKKYIAGVRRFPFPFPTHAPSPERPPPWAGPSPPPSSRHPSSRRRPPLVRRGVWCVCVCAVLSVRWEKCQRRMESLFDAGETKMTRRIEVVPQIYFGFYLLSFCFSKDFKCFVRVGREPKRGKFPAEDCWIYTTLFAPVRNVRQ
jgi:hypothetical protein